MTVSSTHAVVIPSYNTGPQLRRVVAEALRYWQPVVVVIDGSTDRSEEPLADLARSEPGLTVLRHPRNIGKGAAVLTGAHWAGGRGCTHILTMDADGQHSAAHIGELMRVSEQRPEALVLGRPIFPANIPAERLHGRKLSVWLVRLAICGAGIDDPLFGFRVYPVRPLLAALEGRTTARRYDFDAEAAVRMFWAGVPTVNFPAPVRYFSRAEGGVSHFRYVRDNITLTRMHLRLVTGMALRMRKIRSLRRHRSAAGAVAAASDDVALTSDVLR